MLICEARSRIARYQGDPPYARRQSASLTDFALAVSQRIPGDHVSLYITLAMVDYIMRQFTRAVLRKSLDPFVEFLHDGLGSSINARSTAHIPPPPPFFLFPHSKHAI